MAVMYTDDDRQKRKEIKRKIQGKGREKQSKKEREQERKVCLIFRSKDICQYSA
jgi:hypothetical protein